MTRLMGTTLCVMTALAVCSTASAATASEQDEAIYITQMNRCQPQEGLSANMEQGKWQIISYETDGLKGNMVGAYSFVEAPELTVPISVEGWHKIHVGYWVPLFDWDGGTVIKLKLSDQPAFELLTDDRSSDTQDATYLREAFFQEADLTGRDLVIGKPNGLTGKKVYFAYVKLVPMTNEEIAAVQTDRVDTSTRNLTATIDGSSYFHFSEFRTIDDILALVEPYRYSDVGKVIWAVNYGDRTNFPTDVEGAVFVDQASRGPLAGSNVTNDYIRGEKQNHDTLLALSRKGIIVQQAVADRVHKMGRKFDIMFRLGILGKIPRPEGHPGIVAQHPECRQTLRDGTVLEKASYAYPVVQQFVLDLIRDATTKIDADGINMCFVRGPHLLAYEQPVLDAFRKKHGLDAREVDAKDPRLLAARAEIMTRFMRRVRQTLDEVGAARGRRLELSAWAWGHDQNVWLGKTPMEEGLDLQGWISAGLLDSLVCQATVDKEYMRLCKENDCEFIFGYSYGGMRSGIGIDPANVTKAYAQGVDHFVYWDMDCYQIRPEMWSYLRRIGHRGEMANWDHEAHKIKSIPLRKVGGHDVSAEALSGSVFSGG